jgi:hypothetical protein
MLGALVLTRRQLGPFALFIVPSLVVCQPGQNARGYGRSKHRCRRAGKLQNCYNVIAIAGALSTYSGASRLLCSSL